jgi:N utilization substance protein B
MSAAKPVKPRAGAKAAAAPRRSTARLAAVQALYQIELADRPTEATIDDFFHGRWQVLDSSGEGEERKSRTTKPDRNFFADLVRGTMARRADIDRMVDGALSGEWTLERLEAVLRALLRVGAYEILARSDVPARSIIDEYVRLAEAFFDGKQPALVNAVLDRLARTLRPDQMA